MTQGFAPQHLSNSRKYSTRQHAAISPPKKPPRKKGYGGDGSNNDAHIRDIDDGEQLLVLQRWIRTWESLEEPGAVTEEMRLESIELCEAMMQWKRGFYAGQKQRFAMAACKGSSVDAIACLAMGPDNRSFQSFITKDLVMSVIYIAVKPSQKQQIGAGTYLIKELKKIGASQGVRVDFEPLKPYMRGKYYIAAMNTERK